MKMSKVLFWKSLLFILVVSVPEARGAGPPTRAAGLAALCSPAATQYARRFKLFASTHTALPPPISHHFLIFTVMRRLLLVCLGGLVGTTSYFLPFSFNQVRAQRPRDDWLVVAVLSRRCCFVVHSSSDLVLKTLEECIKENGDTTFCGGVIWGSARVLSTGRGVRGGCQWCPLRCNNHPGHGHIKATQTSGVKMSKYSKKRETDSLGQAILRPFHAS